MYVHLFISFKKGFNTEVAVHVTTNVTSRSCYRLSILPHRFATRPVAVPPLAGPDNRTDLSGLPWDRILVFSTTCLRRWWVCLGTMAEEVDLLSLVCSTGSPAATKRWYSCAVISPHSHCCSNDLALEGAWFLSFFLPFPLPPPPPKT